MTGYKCSVCGVVYPKGLRKATTGISVHISQAHPESKPVKDFYVETDEPVDPKLMAKIETNQRSYQKRLERKALGTSKITRPYKKRASIEVPIQAGNTLMVGSATGVARINLPVEIYFTIKGV